jgi:hypothetical protein
MTASTEIQIANWFSVRKNPNEAPVHSCKQFAPNRNICLNAIEGAYVEVRRKRWHGGQEWCEMWCKLGLKDASGTRLMLFDSQHSQRARYVLQIPTGMQSQMMNTGGNNDTRKNESHILTLACCRAAGTDCDRPDKVMGRYHSDSI